MPTLESIKNTFGKMQEAGVNVTKPLLWGYFFTGEENEKLLDLKDSLVSSGLSLSEDIYQTEMHGPFWLHLEEIAVHTPESLYEKCTKLKKEAEISGSAQYDGYDVGNPDISRPITDVK